PDALPISSRRSCAHQRSAPLLQPGPRARPELERPRRRPVHDRTHGVGAGGGRPAVLHQGQERRELRCECGETLEVPQTARRWQRRRHLSVRAVAGLILDHAREGERGAAETLLPAFAFLRVAFRGTRERVCRSAIARTVSNETALPKRRERTRAREERLSREDRLDTIR